MSFPLVHQVLILHGAFECSICRHRYKSREAAQNCLERCFFASIAKQEPVSLKKTRRGSAYVCNWCQRGYQESSQAHACAHLCQETRIKNFRRELDILRFELPEKKPFPVKKPPPVLRHPLARKPPFYDKRHGLRQEPDTHVSIDVPAPLSSTTRSGLPAAPPSAEDMADAGVEMVGTAPSFEGVELVNDAIEPMVQQGEKQRQFLKSGRPPVTKFGVKYRCNLCRTSYFEQKEAEKCFNSHT